MSVDLLHKKIRKVKNPSMVDFSIRFDLLPPHLLEEEGSELAAYGRFCRELMEGLRGAVPAVRFAFDAFALMDGLELLGSLLREARDMGYYVVLDGSAVASPWAAERAAQRIFGGEEYPCDAMIISPYIGTDALKPFLPFCKAGKSLFVTLRSPNKSAAELQDLLTGSRLSHVAAADLTGRMGESILTPCGYSAVGGVVSATNPASVKSLRAGFNRMYLLVDGLDYPSGNHKNCSHAFDRFGHGAVVSAGPSITAVWREGDGDGRDYVAHAQAAAERMKQNLLRYVTVL